MGALKLEALYTKEYLMTTIDRNDLCHCGSNIKYKKCCALHSPVKISPDAQNMDAVVETDESIMNACQEALEMLEYGDLISARMEAKRLINLYPNSPYVLFLQGVYFSKDNDFGSAICCYEKAIKAFPIFPEAFFNMGILYEKHGYIGQAIECYKRVLQIEGMQGEVGFKAAREVHLIEKQVKTKTGLSLNQYIVQSELFNRAMSLLIERKNDMAVKLYSEILKTEPNHIYSHIHLATAYCGLGQNKRALDCLNKALALDASNEQALKNRSLVEKLKEGESLDLEIYEASYHKARERQASRCACC